jgi:hypothetical protein
MVWETMNGAGERFVGDENAFQPHKSKNDPFAAVGRLTTKHPWEKVRGEVELGEADTTHKEKKSTVQAQPTCLDQSSEDPILLSWLKIVFP